MIIEIITWAMSSIIIVGLAFFCSIVMHKIVDKLDDIGWI